MGKQFKVSLLTSDLMPSLTLNKFNLVLILPYLVLIYYQFNYFRYPLILIKSSLVLIHKHFTYF